MERRWKGNHQRRMMNGKEMERKPSMADDEWKRDGKKTINGGWKIRDRSIEDN
jgi:hypothetical protein